MNSCEVNMLGDEATGGPGGRSSQVGRSGDRAAQALCGVKALVVGLASTGVAASRFLAGCGAVVTATDLRDESDLPEAEGLKALGVRIEAGGHRDDVFTGAELVVVSPGVPYKAPFLEKARRAGAEVIGELELASRFIGCPVVAVAGTNGKSTVTELLGHVFAEAGVAAFVGGNLGTPAVEYLAPGGKKGEEKDVCVLEVSSFQLETIKGFRPRVAILLNVTEDHLDRYSDFNEYAETKFRLFANQDSSDYAVVNADDPVISNRLHKGHLGKGLGRPRVVPFSITRTLEEGLYLKGDDIIYAPGPGAAPEAYPTSGLKIKGLHNVENAMAAVAASRLSGVSHGEVLRALATFPGLSHRMELVSVKDGVEYVDDSKGTNVGALIMALKGMTTPVVLIAGGKDKGGDYGVLETLVREKVKRLILIGEAAGRIRDSLGSSTETTMAATLEEAVRAAREAASPGDTVLLSPACSSFDMFSSYKERGDCFKRLVEAL